MDEWVLLSDGDGDTVPSLSDGDTVPSLSDGEGDTVRVLDGGDTASDDSGSEIGLPTVLDGGRDDGADGPVSSVAGVVGDDLLPPRFDPMAAATLPLPDLEFLLGAPYSYDEGFDEFWNSMLIKAENLFRDRYAAGDLNCDVAVEQTAPIDESSAAERVAVVEAPAPAAVAPMETSSDANDLAAVDEEEDKHEDTENRSGVDSLTDHADVVAPTATSPAPTLSSEVSHGDGDTGPVFDDGDTASEDGGSESGVTTVQASGYDADDIHIAVDDDMPPPRAVTSDVAEHAAPVDESSVTVVEELPATASAPSAKAETSGEADELSVDDERDSTEIRSGNAPPTPAAVDAPTMASPPPPKLPEAVSLDDEIRILETELLVSFLTLDADAEEARAREEQLRAQIAELTVVELQAELRKAKAAAEEELQAGAPSQSNCSIVQRRHAEAPTPSGTTVTTAGDVCRPSRATRRRRRSSGKEAAELVDWAVAYLFFSSCMILYTCVLASFFYN